MMKKSLLLTLLLLIEGSIPLRAEICQQLIQVSQAKKNDQNLERMKDLALNSPEFKERAAAASAVLAGYKIPENAQGLIQARELIRSPNLWCRWWGYQFLSYLDLAQVRDAFSKRDLAAGLKDPDVETRVSTVQGLSALGDADLIALLQKTFTSDASPKVRERAACCLSHTGVYSKAQRMKFVPFFIGVMKDPKMDEQTKNWSVQALNYITGLNYGRDIKQWENWEKTN